MEPGTVLLLTWVGVACIVAAYVWFIVWRIRVDRRKKAAAAETPSLLRRSLADLAPVPAPDTVVDADARPSAVTVKSPDVGAEDPTMQAPITASGTTASVVDALAGIQLPSGLVPLTTMTPRPEVGDRIAFWTDEAPAEVVGPAFADELERIGYAVSALDATTIGAQRGDQRLFVLLHPDGPAALLGSTRLFPSVPDMSVVVEVWLPL